MSQRPRRGDVYYDQWNDGLLVVDEILPYFGVFLNHQYPNPRTVRCILRGSWPEGLVYVGRFE